MTENNGRTNAAAPNYIPAPEKGGMNDRNKQVPLFKYRIETLQGLMEFINHETLLCPDAMMLPQDAPVRMDYAAFIAHRHLHMLVAWITDHVDDDTQATHGDVMNLMRFLAMWPDFNMQKEPICRDIDMHPDRAMWVRLSIRRGMYHAIRRMLLQSQKRQSGNLYTEILMDTSPCWEWGHTVPLSEKELPQKASDWRRIDCDGEVVILPEIEYESDWGQVDGSGKVTKMGCNPCVRPEIALLPSLVSKDANRSQSSVELSNAGQEVAPSPDQPRPKQAE